MFTNGNDSYESVPNLSFGRGNGGISGASNLPKQIWDRVYNRQMTAREEEASTSQSTSGTDAAGHGAAKQRKGRKPKKFGMFIRNYMKNKARDISNSLCIREGLKKNKNKKWKFPLLGLDPPP